LIDSSDDFERGLLASSSRDVPSEHAYRRTLAMLGAGAAGAAGAAHGAAGGALSSGKLGGLVLGKWLAAGLALGVAAASGVHFASRAVRAPAPNFAPGRVEASPAARAAAPRRNERTVPLPAPERASAPPSEAPSAPEGARVSRAPRLEAHAVRLSNAAPLRPDATRASSGASVREAEPAVPPVASLRREMQLVEAARAALRHGDGRAALATLERYHSEFAHGELAPEASLLELSALLRAGERERARSLGERLIASDPTSQRADAVRALLAGGDNP
jgi:hypothetical protein